MEPAPQLPTPIIASPIPTVDIAPAKQRPQGLTPNADTGLAVTSFATNLDHPGYIYIPPNGDVLVSDEDGSGA
jgi:glucose/arabinose dehydrogenase